ncbi:EH domain-containing protein 3 [Thecamonas trahens ATCC 50062]|uniref:EH domain-containing protein 3 n=1 Tax=Thecamonas trahens ATCC 50062 TaxID=461836 RepID=A0A0L0D9J8_THETB|nr:EH domain-containing protein 3 [Thecamonas trahens ATCC 50062]KNC49042.1 EH domain-containing protein 3 [Thecamonas trahens ATCC 50062]|eukprot:XP_013758078.1 EH domain-containing protein 3 [Thecamonas trahens ATCC 50062]
MAAISNKAAMSSDAVETYPEVIEKLKRLYKTRIRPVEELYSFQQFHSPLLEDADFEAAPMVMLLGQYSVGKTSFIRYMLERDFPSQRIGPEPTTDRFVAVMYGEEDRVVPGAAASIRKDKPFQGLDKFGVSFLSKFEVAECPSPILEKVTFIDTPGVLSGEKQRLGRTYDFVETCEWFAERSDLILLLFDAHKLDISDEFKRSIEALRGHDDKIRVVLNKSDMVNSQQLMRVYGALMWSLGKVFATPEVVRVYIGSFWDQPLHNSENQALFEAEEQDLMADLRYLPRNAAVRKINELVKRARLVKVHALLISHLRGEMPSMFGKGKKQKALLDGMLEVFKTVMRQHQLPPGDFPDLERFKARAAEYEFNKFPKLNMSMIESMNSVLAADIPQLLELIAPVDDGAGPSSPPPNPFGASDSDWAIGPEEKQKWDSYFVKMGPVAGKLSGASAKPAMVASKLDTTTLRDIWTLADIDRDGHLDADEFAVCMHLLQQKKNAPGSPLPTALPANLVPPSKRGGSEASPFD